MLSDHRRLWCNSVTNFQFGQLSKVRHSLIISLIISYDDDQHLKIKKQILAKLK